MRNRETNNAYSREYYQTHKVSVTESKKKYNASHRESINKRHREYKAKKKLIVFEAYGNKCACCGENQKEFLTIDHVNGGGHVHRERVGTNVYLDIIREGFPTTYQLLCFNCNCAKGIYGACPHNIKLQKEAG